MVSIDYLYCGCSLSSIAFTHSIYLLNYCAIRTSQTDYFTVFLGIDRVCEWGTLSEFHKNP
ncbi:hypothetical protein ACJBRG_11520, partial [Streptococcus suis]